MSGVSVKLPYYISAPNATVYGPNTGVAGPLQRKAMSQPSNLSTIMSTGLDIFTKTLPVVQSAFDSSSARANARSAQRNLTQAQVNAKAGTLLPKGDSEVPWLPIAIGAGGLGLLAIILMKR